MSKTGNTDSEPATDC